jgi:hypothetical protein
MPIGGTSEVKKGISDEVAASGRAHNMLIVRPVPQQRNMPHLFSDGYLLVQYFLRLLASRCLHDAGVEAGCHDEIMSDEKQVAGDVSFLGAGRFACMVQACGIRW